MAIASNFPAIRPSLNLDFANARALDPRITFSRASAATYYDGKTVAKAEENLLLRSQEFDQAPWVVNAAGVATAPVRTANYGVAPDGTSTADRAVFSLNGGTTATDLAQVMQNIAVTFGATYTFSVWAKATDGASSYSIQLAGPGAATSVAVTGTWTRFSVTGTASGASFDFQIRLRGGQTPATSDSADILLWGAQLEQRSQVTAYTPTTTQPITNYIPVLQTAPAGVPRFGHNPVTGESLGLLTEEQRTNLLTYSEQLDNAVWPKANATITPNSVTSPAGTLDADIFASSATAGGYYYRSVALSAGSTYTYSCYFKQFGGNTSHNFYFNDSAPGQAVVAILATNGVLSIATISSSGVFSSASASITSVGNGWYRVSLTATYAGGLVPGVALASNTGRDGYSGLCVWGLQLEAGSFPTSYIKTEASQVTRAADSAQMTGANFSSWYRQDEGTVFCESESAGYNTTNITATSVSFHDGTINNRIRFAHAGNVRFNVAVNGIDSAGLTNAYTNGTMVKNAACYKVDNFAYASAGQVAQTDNSGVVPVVNQMGIGGWLTGRDNNGHIKRIAYYPKRLTDAQLQALTA